MRHRSLTFYTGLYSLSLDGGASWYALPVPVDAEVDQFADQLLIKLRSEWTPHGSVTFSQGTLLGVAMEDFVAKGVEGV